MTAKTYKDNDGDFEVEYGEETKLKLPPRPVPLYKEDPETDPKKFEGDLSNIPRRAAHKLYNVWLLWVALRCNEKIEKMIQNEEADQTSDAFLMKATFVQILDQLAKILVDGDIVQEIAELLKEGNHPE